MERLVVVGGGILGTMHAVEARRLGIQVVHLERDAEPRSATVRNFGLVWVSGRAVGEETEVALRARSRWEEIATQAPGVGFRPDGSLTLVQTEAELAVLRAVCAREDAAVRGFTLLGPEEVRRLNPALHGDFLAGLHCTTDAVVEPRLALPALRGQLLAGPGYTWLPGTTAMQITGGGVTDHRGVVHAGDHVVVCPGAVQDGCIAELLEGAPLRQVQLQMMQTDPLGARLTTSLADGNSLRYYPAFDVPELADLQPAAPLVTTHRMQLLVSQRAGGELTIGDTHASDLPLDFAVDETPYAFMAMQAERLLGRPLPPVRRRWNGVYSQHTEGAVCHREEVMSGVTVVTGPGGRGMTLSPALAEDTLAGLESPSSVATAGSVA